jgi:hypothetical protein
MNTIKTNLQEVPTATSASNNFDQLKQSIDQLSKDEVLDLLKFIDSLRKQPARAAVVPTRTVNKQTILSYDDLQKVVSQLGIIDSQNLLKFINSLK